MSTGHFCRPCHITERSVPNRRTKFCARRTGNTTPTKPFQRRTTYRTWSPQSMPKFPATAKKSTLSTTNRSRRIFTCSVTCRTARSIGSRRTTPNPRLVFSDSS
uniref:(northern house mosquito) hypothetical protein n=1 Tax=Culex pipiens TaxID=7175 RepID=A0A8D8D750_CULPI